MRDELDRWLDHSQQTKLAAGLAIRAKHDSLASQQLFESMFDHTPRVDTRTPADVAAQRGEWRR